MITLLMDLKSQTWVCEGEAEHDSAKVLVYYLTSPDVKIVKNFHFSYYLQSDEVDVEAAEIDTKQRGIDPSQSEEGPGNVHKILVAEVEYSNLRPDTKYHFDLSASNRRKPFEGRFDFTTKISPRPYDSWVWNSETKEWEAPVEQPELVWDEESASWIIP